MRRGTCSRTSRKTCSAPALPLPFTLILPDSSCFSSSQCYGSVPLRWESCDRRAARRSRCSLLPCGRQTRYTSCECPCSAARSVPWEGPAALYEPAAVRKLVRSDVAASNWHLVVDAVRGEGVNYDSVRPATAGLHHAGPCPSSGGSDARVPPHAAPSEGLSGSAVPHA